LIYGSFAKLFSLGRVRLVLTLHTLLDIEQNRRYRFYYKFFLHFADRVIAVSPGVEAGLLALGVSPARISVIPNGVSFSLRTQGVEPAERCALRRKLVPDLSQDFSGARWMLCLARLHPGKGQDIVLDLWSALPDSARAELVLFFVGQETKAGYRKTLQEKINRLPDHGRIIVAGPSEHPQDWIQSADIFISGSLLEGMPLAPLEAAGSGLPTLLSDIEGHRFLESWAHYFDPRKPEEGARKVLEILQMLKNEEGHQLWASRWEAAAPLRHMWGTAAMTTSYAETFELA
jgi:glycosyltransferase involved in cell wall biosynthesis